MQNNTLELFQLYQFPKALFRAGPGKSAKKYARVAKPDVTPGDVQWKLLVIHSARLDVGTRDPELSEALGLNCAW